MKKKYSILIATVLSLMVIALTAASYSSSIWTQKFRVGNLKHPMLLDKGWTVKKNASFPQEGILTIQKVFYFDEFQKLVGQTQQEFISDLAQSGAYITTPSLLFFTHNQKVRVFMNTGKGDFMVYQFGTEGSRYAGSESGNAIHSVRVPYMENEAFIVTIEFSPSFSSGSIKLDHLYYKLFPTRLPPIFFGFGAQNLQFITTSTWFQWLPALLIFMFAVAALVQLISFAILRKKAAFQSLNQCIFAQTVGFYNLFESLIGTYIMASSFAAYFLSSVLLAFHPFMLITVLQERKNITHTNRLSSFLKLLSLFNVFICCINALFPLIPLCILRIYFGAVVYACVAIGTTTLIHEIITERNSVDVLDIVLFIVILAFIVDLICAFTDPAFADFFRFTRWAAVIFFATFTIISMQDFFQSEIHKAQSTTLKKANIQDSVTGCKRSLLMWEEEKFFHNAKPYAILLTGIPYFISIRRNKSQDETELILRYFAQTLHSLFPEENVYYISNSRFAVYIPIEEYEHISDAISKLEKSLSDFNRNEPGFNVSLVTVLEEFDPERDHDLDGLLVRLLSELRYKAVEFLSRT